MIYLIDDDDCFSFRFSILSYERMRATGCLKNVLRSNLMQTMRAREAKTVTKFRKSRASGETNSLHKAMYVSAMVDVIEEHGRKDAEKRNQRNTTLLSFQPDELTHDLVGMNDTTVNKDVVSLRSAESSGELEPFGSWRDVSTGSAALEARRKYLHTAKYSIVDSSLIPSHIASTELLLQRTPQITRTKTPQGPLTSSSSTLRELFFLASKRNQGPFQDRIVGARMGSVLNYKSSTEKRDQTTDVFAATASLLVAECARHSWVRALTFVNATMPQNESPVQDLDVAFWGALQRHYGHRRQQLPDAMRLMSLTRSHPNLLASSSSWAPFLALLYTTESPSTMLDTNTSKWKAVLELFDGKSGRTLRMLPAVAAGELLRALYRSGAPLSAVQSCLDALTDTALGRVGDRNMSSHHLYAGYISGAPWEHALEIYETHAPHYDVRRTARLVAAVMHSLNSNNRYSDAMTVFKRFVGSAPGTETYTHTTETVVELLTALRGQSDVVPPKQVVSQAIDAMNCLCVSYGFSDHTLLHPPQALPLEELAGCALRWHHSVLKRYDVHPAVLAALLSTCNRARSVIRVSDVTPLDDDALEDPLMEENNFGGLEEVVHSSRDFGAEASAEEIRQHVEPSAEDLAALLMEI